MPDPKFESIRAAAAERPHGTRARYVAGKCRCLLCRAANSRYQTERDQAQRRGEWNGIVSAEAARLHLKWLAGHGVGRRSVAAACDVALSTLIAIRNGSKTKIRAGTARAILALDEGARGGKTLVGAGETWRRLNELIGLGYSRAQLARWLGYQSPAIQIRHDRCTWETAVAVAKLYRRIERGALARPGAPDSRLTWDECHRRPAA